MEKEKKRKNKKGKEKKRKLEVEPCVSCSSVPPLAWPREYVKWETLPWLGWLEAVTERHLGHKGVRRGGGVQCLAALREGYPISTAAIRGAVAVTPGRFGSFRNPNHTQMEQIWR